MPNRNSKISFVFLLLLMAMMMPGEAQALQVHGEPEGLYVHQMAHLFYILALGYFFWDIRRTAFSGRGWRYLQLFCVLMVFWNLLAFSGHAADVFIYPEELSQTDCYLQTRLIGPFTIHKYLYYFARLDHLICVPGLFFLFLGIRSFYKSVAKASKQEDL
jgi:hypothetical protein